MTVTIELPQATVENLKAEAAATGKDIQTIAREAVEARFAQRRRTFAEILRPIHDEVESSGASKKELEEFADRLVTTARTERAASRKKQ